MFQRLNPLVLSLIIFIRFGIGLVAASQYGQQLVCRLPCNMALIPFKTSWLALLRWISILLTRLQSKTYPSSWRLLCITNKQNIRLNPLRSFLMPMPWSYSRFGCSNSIWKVMARASIAMARAFLFHRQWCLVARVVTHSTRIFNYSIKVEKLFRLISSQLPNPWASCLKHLNTIKPCLPIVLRRPKHWPMANNQTMRRRVIPVSVPAI